MKKTIITLSLALLLCTSTLLASCGDNTVTDGGAGGAGGTAGSAMPGTETESNVADGARRLLGRGIRAAEEATEYATHGIEDGTPRGDSHRGGADMPLIPRGK